MSDVGVSFLLPKRRHSVSATRWSCCRHKKMSCRQGVQNDMTFEDMSGIPNMLVISWSLFELKHKNSMIAKVPVCLGWFVLVGSTWYKLGMSGPLLCRKDTQCLPRFGDMSATRRRHKELRMLVIICAFSFGFIDSNSSSVTFTEPNASSTRGSGSRLLSFHGTWRSFSARPSLHFFGVAAGVPAGVVVVAAAPMPVGVSVVAPLSCSQTQHFQKSKAIKSDSVYQMQIHINYHSWLEYHL